MPLRPYYPRLVGKFLQPLTGLASAGAAMQLGHEGGKIITHVHRHLGVWKHTPDRTRQCLIAKLGDPAPPGIVNGKREARPKNRTRLFGEEASRKINAAQFSFGNAAANLEQCPVRWADNGGKGELETVDDFRTKSR
jgi:hypothetical protein